MVHAIEHGLSNREIARRRGISLDAVKYHVANAVAKLGRRHPPGPAQMVSRPAGSALSQRTRSPMSMNLSLGPLAQIARGVRDLKESEAWYGKTLGLKHLYSVWNARLL